MAVTYANSWDAAKILKGMDSYDKQALKAKIEELKAASALSGRAVNQTLLTFVEKRLAEEEACTKPE